MATEVIGLIAALVGLVAAIVSLIQVSRGRRHELDSRSPRAESSSPASSSAQPIGVGSAIEKHTDRWAAVRDGSLILTVSIVVVILVFAGPSGSAALAIALLVVLLIGLTISAARSRGNTWIHLAIVTGVIAIPVCLVLPIVVPLGFVEALLLSAVVALLAGVAGAIATVVKK